ncbi:MAG TPA: F0F1 ATP synthase subunit A, partial [Alphaproteobacteria bacterium]|nr:F0F1 ATP synthase subunit A [Alphaproteobacteria bacterium]
MASPLEQFEIKTIGPTIEIGGLDFSFTNSAAWMVVATVAATLLLRVGASRRALIPGRMQVVAEMAYEFIANMIRDNVGDAGRRFFPYIFTLFMFILFGNLLGLIPYSFTYTSHIVVTGALAIIVFLGVTVVGIARHGLHFFTFFVPSGVPWIMLPLMIPIEIIS